MGLAMRMTVAARRWLPAVATLPRPVSSTGTAGRQERADLGPGARGGRSRRYDTRLRMLGMCSRKHSVRLPENGHGSVCAPYVLSPADLRVCVCGKVHHDAQIFRDEHWRVVCSTRPVAHLLKLGWARILLFLIGMWILLRNPEGIVRFSWLETLHQSGVRPARMLRFTPVALPNGQKRWDAPLELDVGLLGAGCKL